MFGVTNKQGLLKKLGFGFVEKQVLERREPLLPVRVCKIVNMSPRKEQN